ncbi:MarR family transcriptional regulator [Streptomyces sp. NPDC059166]|uniref:MarR family transcriptional regulator n=1 Tax=Streptomyces sp. NPDC059166 TaxID=3346752 RepID=UPI0036A28994
MAVQHLSSAPSAPASSRAEASRPYRQAPSGYGKRSAPDQRPASAADFACLPARERYVAGYVDHLPEGAAMDIKSLAKDLPLYGQMAIGSALRALAVAGHLRHVRCRVESLGQSRWVTLTYWSRTARDNEWWSLQLASGGSPAGSAAGSPAGSPAGSSASAASIDSTAATVAPEVPRQRVPEQPPEPDPGPVAGPAPAAPAPAPAEAGRATEPERSPAYLALARLGRADARLTLSAKDCEVLEGLAAAWFERGVDADYLTRALTAGLPAQVGSPVGLVRRRLTDKLPARLPGQAVPAPDAPVRAVLVECADCGRPGPPEALPDGLCRACRQTAAASPGLLEAPALEPDIEAHMKLLREKLRLP